MMEKNGCLQLESGEFFQIQLGQVPERIQKDLGLSLEELRVILQKNEFEITDVNPTTLQSGI